MTYYEIKKVFSRTGSQIALLVLLAVVGVTSFFAVDVSWVDENGDSQNGPAAVARLREAQKEWAGELDEEVIRQVILENQRIKTSPEARADNIQENDIAYGWGQGIEEIRRLLNYSYASDFQEFDYYRADSLTEDQALDFYSNRLTLLKTWLDEGGKDQFSDAEKEYLVAQYEQLDTPFYYDYMKGWTQLFEYAPTIVMITMLILGYLTSGIFSCEFAWKSDAIFFSSMNGRNQATVSKIKAGFCVTTLIYWGVILLYSAIVLFYLGTDGWFCPVQADWSGWKCFYNITVLQKYVLIIIGGYIGCLFISFLGMLVSAKTKSTVIAVIVPFVLIFIPSFLGNINSQTAMRILGLLPDQLLQVGMAMGFFNLYSFGGKMVGAIPVLLVLYTILTGVLLPGIYWEYRHKEIG